MRHVQALLNWILLSTGRTDLKRLVVVVVVVVNLERAELDDMERVTNTII